MADGKAYRKARGCIGAQHVIFVPPGRIVDDVWAEIVTLGRLLDLPAGLIESDGTWATVECSGGADCECLQIDAAPDYRHYHNDVLVFGPPQPEKTDGFVGPVTT